MRFWFLIGVRVDDVVVVDLHVVDADVSGCWAYC